MSDLLSRCGSALYGPYWQRELARSLGLTDRTVQRWAAAGAAAPERWPDILRLLTEREVQLRALTRELRSQQRKSAAE